MEALNLKLIIQLQKYNKLVSSHQNKYELKIKILWKQLLPILEYKKHLKN